MVRAPGLQLLLEVCRGSSPEVVERGDHTILEEVSHPMRLEVPMPWSGGQATGQISRGTLLVRTIAGPFIPLGPADAARVRSMAGLPELTDEQRRAALAKAAEARRIRAEVKDRLKMGSLSLSELLAQADGDIMLAKMKVLAVLESLPKLGKVKARRTMDEVGISDTRRLRGLGAQQRAELVARFG